MSAEQASAAPAGSAGTEHLGEWDLQTRAIRGGIDRTQFDETSAALFLTSGYVFDSAEAAEAAFNGDIDRFVYSRYGNPTVAAFQERLRLLEGAEACFATASGMSAVFIALGALLSAGDRVVAARSLFGSCFAILNEILPRWGVETEFVDGHDLEQWEQALATPATAVFFESPSNPLQEIVDIRAVVQLAHASGARVVVDNVFATPLLQRTTDLGADVVVYSGTKHMDGQGRVLGGAVLGSAEFIDGPVRTLMRHTGPALSPFNAWTLLKGLETMPLRVERSVASALSIAAWLEEQPGVRNVIYPFLESHPQYQLARSQMTAGGTVVTFELVPGNRTAKETAFRLINGLRIVDISNNLGDTKSLITHPATTTHRAMGPEGRASIGLGDGIVRISVGLETTDDLINDLDGALAALGT